MAVLFLWHERPDPTPEHDFTPIAWAGTDQLVGDVLQRELGLGLGVALPVSVWRPGVQGGWGGMGETGVGHEPRVFASVL